MSEGEFKEIAHSGGQVIIRIGTDKHGQRGHQLTWTNQRPVPSGLFAIYARAEGKQRWLTFRFIVGVCSYSAT